jgi:hypothetical protein
VDQADVSSGEGQKAATGRLWPVAKRGRPGEPAKGDAGVALDLLAVMRAGILVQSLLAKPGKFSTLLAGPCKRRIITGAAFDRRWNQPCESVGKHGHERRRVDWRKKPPDLWYSSATWLARRKFHVQIEPLCCNRF